jgi:hypothetical protein
LFNDEGATSGELPYTFNKSQSMELLAITINMIMIIALDGPSG